MGVGINQQILRLNVSVANTKRMDVSQGPESLVGVQLNEDHGHLLLHFVVVLQDPEHGLRHVVHYYVQVDLIVLVALSVERMLQSYYVRVIELLHYLQFSVLVSFVLVHFLNGYLLRVLVHGGLKHHAERSVSHNSIGVVSERSWFLVFFFAFGLWLLGIHFI